MKERLINNLGLKILSIFLAFFVWLVVVNVSNPEVTRSQEVQLEIENEQVLLAANQTYELNGKSTVTVTYGVRTRDEYKIRSTDFRAYINLAELYDVTGSVPVKVEVLTNKGLLNDVGAKPGVVEVKTEALQRKRFDLSVITTGEPAEGYALNGVEIQPQYVYVEGPISEVGQISHVGIEINMDGLSEAGVGIADPIFYDANANQLKISNRIKSDTTEVQYQLNINRVKKLSLDFDVSGVVATGYQYVGVECDTKSVSVIGLRTNLASINKITVPATVLNLDGATADKVIKVNLQNYLPEGVAMVQSEEREIEVKLRVERLQTMTMRLSETDITKTGAIETYLYRITPTPVVVTLQGLKEDLEGLTVKDLGASIAVSGFAVGPHKGTLTFKTSDAFRILTYGDIQVEVSQKEPGLGETTTGTLESVKPEITETQETTMTEESNQTKESDG